MELIKITMVTKKDGFEDWANYYRKPNVETLKSYGYFLNKFILNSFQKVIFKEISKKIELLLKQKNKISILSMGSGIDFIAYHLKRRFKNKIEVNIFDISLECVNQNKKLFKNSCTYTIGNIFSYDFKSKFDIVYNTGLLEHFSYDKQKKIIQKTKSVLNSNGYYITMHPYTGGKLYVKYMKIAKEKNIWDFGEEIPIKSLNSFSSKSFNLIEEAPSCSLFQFSFLIYGNKAIFILFLPLIIFFRFTYLRSIDIFFGKYIGYYHLMSIFKKN